MLYPPEPNLRFAVTGFSAGRLFSRLAGHPAPALILVVLTAVGALTFAPSTGASAADAPAVVIKMSDKPPQFLPDKVTIKKGQTIQWVNNAKTLHSVDGDPSMALFPADVSLPPGAKPFDSGFMKPDVSWQYTFSVPGTYKYTCVPHEKDHMNGQIVVK